MLISIQYLLIAIFFSILTIDTFPLLKDWISRIYIGRYQNKNHWYQTITSVGVKWLNHTPTVKVTDNSRFIVVDMVKKNYTKSNIQHWQEASLLLGIGEYLKYNKDDKAQIEVIKFLNRKFDENGQWRIKPEFVDAAILAYSVMNVPFIESNNYKKAFDHVWCLIKNQIGKDGTVRYRSSMENYRYVDTIGFICPFLIAYGVKYKKKLCIDLAIKQLQEFEKFGFYSKAFIPYHAYNIDNKIPQGLLGWGRGLGWYAIGLIDSWGELPEGHIYKDVLEKSIKKFVESASRFQLEKGCWNWTISRNESRPDSSTTSTLAWFFLKASKIKELEKECFVNTEKALGYLITVTKKNGEIDFSQGDTKDIGVYSMLFNKLPFTQGFCIRTESLLRSLNLRKEGVKCFEEAGNIARQTAAKVI
jgi:unsaturated rhamnogalacturonyl hydrolase